MSVELLPFIIVRIIVCSFMSHTLKYTVYLYIVTRKYIRAVPRTMPIYCV